jgi:hypothetical protein
MDSATQARNFYLAFFHKGDEIFHRGPLFGHRRSEALEELETAVALRPDFAPAWEHLTWLRIAEDDEAGARHALDNFERARPVQDQISMGVQFLLNAAFAYRFLPAGTGDGMVQQALLIPEMDDFPNLAMAPRLMLTFDAPTGSVGMGKLFAGRNTVADVRSGLLAQVLGYLAQGLPDSALRYAERLKARVPRQEIFAAQLEGTLALVDGDSTNASTAARERARDELRRYILPSAGTEEARARAAWLLALLSRRAGDGPTAHRATQVIRDGSLELREYYLALLQADSLASSAQYQQALGLTDWDGDALVRLSDPFLSTVIHLFRADWFLADGNPQAALRTLVWHEAYDFATYPVGDPQAPEIDQAFSTLSRWKQARLMDLNQSSTAEACRAYRAVTRHWKQGSPRSRERADIAEQRLATLPCSS